MNSHKRQCPHCQTLLDDVRQHGDIELGHCGQCGDVPLATVYQRPLDDVARESSFKAVALNDGTQDYLLRLARLLPAYNVVQLKGMEITSNGRRVIPLGIVADTINIGSFMEQVAALQLDLELEPVVGRRN